MPQVFAKYLSKSTSAGNLNLKEWEQVNQLNADRSLGEHNVKV